MGIAEWLHTARWQALKLAGALAFACTMGAALAPASAFAAPTWRTMHTIGESMSSVQCLDATHSWVVGYDVLATTDGGASWTPGAQSGNYLGFRDVMFLDAEHGWAVGDGIASTSDGGKTWVKRSLGAVQLPRFESIASVWFTDANHGWITGGFGIAHTADGGAHWALQKSAGYDFGDYVPRSIRFGDALHGCAVNEAGVLLTTSDGGVHWRQRKQPIEGELSSIAFRDPTHAFVGSWYGMLLVAIDGSSAPQYVGPWDMAVMAQSFADSRHGWVADDTRVWSTADGGKTWHQHDPHTGQPITGISFADDEHGMLVGSAGLVMATSDGGVTWHDVSFGSADTYFSPTFTDATHGWMLSGPLVPAYQPLALGTGAVLGTTDSGQHWERLYGGTSMRTFPYYLLFDAASPWTASTDLPMALSFADAQHGMMAGFSGAIRMTDDGGRTWGAPHDLPENAAMGDAAVCRVDADHAWVLTRGGGVYATSDGGATWATQRASADMQYGASGELSFADASNGCAVMSDGAILHTSDGGAHWGSGFAPGSPMLASVSVVDARHAWASGRDGALLFSADGGATWSAQSIGTTATVASVRFSDTTHGRALAGGYDSSPDRVAWVTSDGGSHWATETAEWPIVAAGSLSAPDLMHAWAVGYQGVVMRRATDDPLTDLEPYPVGWVQQPVQVSLSATQGAGASSVTGTFYRAGGGAPQPYSAPFQISAEGTTSLEYWSVDASGDVEPTETALVRIDDTPPTAVIDVSGSPYVGAGTPSVIASDALSGVDIVETWTDRTGLSNSGSIAEWNAGARTAYARVVDRAGNEITVSATFTVLPPLPCKLTTPVRLNTAHRGRPFTLVGRVVPAHSTPVSVVIERRRSGRWHVYASTTVSSGAPGKWLARLTLPAGTFRIRAVSPRIATYAAAASAWRTVTVR